LHSRDRVFIHSLGQSVYISNGIQVLHSRDRMFIHSLGQSVYISNGVQVFTQRLILCIDLYKCLREWIDLCLNE